MSLPGPGPGFSSFGPTAERSLLGVVPFDSYCPEDPTQLTPRPGAAASSASCLYRKDRNSRCVNGASFGSDQPQFGSTYRTREEVAPER